MAAAPHSHLTALTIGTFDGVHRGHAALLRRGRELVGPRGRLVAMTFDPHPAAVLRPGAEPPRLTTLAHRTELLRAAGADEVVRLTPTTEFLNLTPEQFIARCVEGYHPAWIVEGPDFRFGHNRAGDTSVLEILGRGMGFGVEVLEPECITLGDHLVARASSTLIRWLLGHGRVGDAARILGRPYRVPGTVVRGDQRGRTIGFPTANLRPETMLPADGVYAAVAKLADGRSFAAAVNIGTRPTFSGVDRRCEAHLLMSADQDAAGFRPIDGLPDYEWSMELDFVAWIRDQVRFAGIDALTAQLRRDVERVARVIDTASVPQESKA